MKAAYVFALTLVLWGCAQLGLAPAQTFEQRLAYSYGVHMSVLQAATTAVQSKAVTADDAKQILALADESRALLDAARVTGDPTIAQNKLMLATQVLTQVQAYLNSRGIH